MEENFDLDRIASHSFYACLLSCWTHSENNENTPSKSPRWRWREKTVWKNPIKSLFLLMNYSSSRVSIHPLSRRRLWGSIVAAQDYYHSIFSAQRSWTRLDLESEFTIGNLVNHCRWFEINELLAWWDLTNYSDCFFLFFCLELSL